MQNRGVFPYRRQGSKKRNRNGADRRPRPPQKGLPNNARDLLPMMQPATKALAQMLSGRVPRSGQLGHAQAIAGQADRLISERAHNRLNPSEREEFFEQIARLKLTLADAQAEAEEQGEQEPVVKAAPRQLAPARLKEMALALAGPERARPSDAAASEDAGQAAEAPVEAEPKAEPSEARASEGEAGQAPEPARNGADPEPAESTLEAPEGRLQLSGTAARKAADALSDDERNLRASRRAQATRRKAGSTTSDNRAGSEPARERDGEAQAAEQPGESVADVDEGDGAARDEGDGAARKARGATSDDGQGRSASARRAPKRHKQKGVPEGWVIDEEGFVVPGPG